MPSYTNADADIAAFSAVPPPPYPGEGYDLTPTPQSVNRPRLPEERRNPYLQALPEDVTIVKFQTIVREGKEIIIGRIKVQTPPTSGGQHAFILRRYDTDAISLSTMFKVAFPGATEDDEKREMDWVRSSYDTRGTNGGRDCDAVRLAGQWVSRHLAIHLAPHYGISALVLALSKAAPDPNVSYRKSQRSQAAADELAKARQTGQNDQPASSTSPSRPVPSMSADAEAAPTPKRRRNVDSQPSEDQRELTLQATTTVTAPAGAPIDVDGEIESAKQLVRDLRRQMELNNAAADALEETGAAEAESSASASSRGRKRTATAAGDDGTVISGGAGKNAVKRVIRTNKRVEEQSAAGTVKRVAYGAMLFGLGASAALLLPQLAANYL